MKINRNYILLACLSATIALAGLVTVPENTPHLKFQIDTNVIFSTTTISASNSEYVITHSPSKDDSEIYRKYIKLISAEPDMKNYLNYYSLACSLWELGKTDDAKKMFLKILDSNEKCLTSTYYHSSDIPGDTSSNTSGYGSFTSNYKNYSCNYLAKISIEERKFDEAIKYIETADDKFPVEYNCGTGYMMYREQINRLYGLCYEGLGRYDSIINLFFRQPDWYHNELLVRAIKKVYSKAEIINFLKIALNSVDCIIDTFQSTTSTTHNYGKENESTSFIKYTSGRATISLFGKKVELPPPDLNDGERASEEHFRNDFKESVFYKLLIEDS